MGTLRIACVEIDGGSRLNCICPADLAIHERDTCIVDAEGVLEFGQLVDITERESEKAPTLPTVLRRATLQDHAKADENAVMKKIAKDACAVQIEKLSLTMRLVSVHYSFDRARLTVLFSADDRVDFREMVKDLAAELRTRVEMKQIGVRDEAGVIGGMGPCGRKICCCTWLHRFASINVKMAKAQKLSLNPSAISGMCGRLKCCLQYEFDHYKEKARGLPRNRSRVECPDGQGIIVDRDILGRRLTIRMENGRTVTHPVEDVQGVE